MMKSAKYKWMFCILVVSSFLLFASCEGYKLADGAVYEHPSKLPLDSVLCSVLETGEQTYTDSLGKYYLEGPFGSCMFECKDMSVEFSKVGYKTYTVLNPNSALIYLKK